MANDWRIDYFGEYLLTKDGMKPTLEVLKNKKRIGIYFSAHWCPPCRGFTPTLAELYKALKEHQETSNILPGFEHCAPEQDVHVDSNYLEIVFVSGDHSPSEFEHYYSEQPWTALPFSSPNNGKLSRLYSVSGIPHLVIINGTNGKVVDSYARWTVSYAKGLFGWIFGGISTKSIKASWGLV